MEVTKSFVAGLFAAVEGHRVQRQYVGRAPLFINHPLKIISLIFRFAYKVLSLFLGVLVLKSTDAMSVNLHTLTYTTYDFLGKKSVPCKNK